MLSEIQKRIVEAPYERIVVNAAAASGKTAVLTERVKWLLEQGANPKKMVVITFTNAAAEEMRKRIGAIASEVFIGTIHSYANYLLLSHGIDTNKWLQDEDFDALFWLIKKNPQVINSVDWLLLDEAQDSNEQQHKFIFEMIKPKCFFVVGDLRQCIYSFNGSRPDLFMDLASQDNVTTYNLNENYRNGEEILKFAKWILQAKANEYATNYYYRDNSVAKSKIIGSKIDMVYDIDRLAELIKKSNDFKEWFILTRDNKQLDKIFELLSAKGIPCTTFKRKDITNDELSELMNKNTVKVLTIHTSKGLEAKYVVVIGAHMYNEEECRVAYVAATRAKNLLIWVKGTTPRKKKAIIKNWE